MEFTVRQCCMEDTAAIYELNKAEMGYDYPAEKTREKLAALMKSENDRIFVAEANGIVVGYVHAAGYDLIYAPPMKNIMGIAVAAGYRRQGIGRALLNAAEVWARESGAAGVRLASGASRTGAHQFYQSAGYSGGRVQYNFKKMF